jgi:uncharacterized protein YaiL (DUF2058 family)
VSLRDQLLQKGLATKKDVRRVEQELDRDRRAREANKRSKAEEDASRSAAEAREAAARAEAKRAARTAYAEARERTERALQVRNLVSSNAVRAGGPIPFFHRVPGSAALGSIHVGVPLAGQLRRGDVAIAALPAAGGHEYRVIRRAAAERLADIAPQLLVFWNRDPSGTLAPDQQPLARNWESALGPHRATAADLARFIGVSGR